MPVHSANHCKTLPKLLALDPACRLVVIVGVSIGAFLSGTLQSSLVLADEATPAISSAVTGFSPRAAATWVFDQQLADGGFPGPTGASDLETTINAVLAGYAWGVKMPQSQVLARARAYLVANGPAYAALGSGQAARLALAVLALGDDPGAFGAEDPTYCDNVGGVGGLNLFSFFISPSATPVPGAIPAFDGGDVRDQAYVLLALSATYVSVSDAALEPLRVAQAPNGGWARDGSGDPDAITTALVIQALSVTSLSDEWSDPGMDLRGIDFLRSLRVPTGGFASDNSEPLVADAASTAAVIQALIAAGEEPASPKWGNAPQTLAQFQTASGRFRTLLSDAEPNLQATLQVLPAMVEKPLPIAYECRME